MTHEPREVGMLFTGESVRAFLENRKTQTRRLQGLRAINKEPDAWTSVQSGIQRESGRLWFQFHRRIGLPTIAYAKAAPGDVIYCKETFVKQSNGTVLYRAGNGPKLAKCFHWKSSIFMPKASARIRRTVKAVRCERLQDITEEDAIAEGIEKDPFSSGPSARSLYAELWESINGPGSWDKNQFVFRYEFKKI